VATPDPSPATGVPRLVVRVFRGHWRQLLVIGLLVFVPLGLVDVIGERVTSAIEVDDANAGALIEVLAAFAVSAVAALAGEAIYAGVVAGAVVAGRAGDRRSAGELIRRLQIRRLVIIDLLAAALIAVGYLALFVPGLLFTAWFALVAPATELEGSGVAASFRRSRELVRGRFWLVLAIVLPILIAQELLSNLAQSASWWELGEGFAGDWVGSVLANLLTAPLYALAVTILFLELRERSTA
jgi:hypothetical protein